MAYWWVSQNRTFTEEQAGGYLWAPKKNKLGQGVFHWSTMKDLRDGDIVFSYVGQKIVAVSNVNGKAYDYKNPFSKSGEEWDVNGWKVDLNYNILDTPIIISSIVEELQECLQSQLEYKPLNRNGTGNQGYLFPLIDKAGIFLLSKTQNL